jgi:hypothetical protein
VDFVEATSSAIPLTSNTLGCAGPSVAKQNSRYNGDRRWFLAIYPGNTLKSCDANKVSNPSQQDHRCHQRLAVAAGDDAAGLPHASPARYIRS